MDIADSKAGNPSYTVAKKCTKASITWKTGPVSPELGALGAAVGSRMPIACSLLF